MGNKIVLIYEDGKFNVAINENIIYEDKDMEKALIKFNQVVKNNAIQQSNSWDYILESVKSNNLSGVEINSEFKTLTFGSMKYFYNTDKVFYITSGNMISLGGGFSLFNFVLNKIGESELEDEISFLELCKISMMNKAIFSAHEETITISTPKFSYGTVAYNFATKKINKGTSSEKGSFEEFKNYVLETLK